MCTPVLRTKVEQYFIFCYKFYLPQYLFFVLIIHCFEFYVALSVLCAVQHYLDEITFFGYSFKLKCYIFRNHQPYVTFKFWIFLFLFSQFCIWTCITSSLKIISWCHLKKMFFEMYINASVIFIKHERLYTFLGINKKVQNLYIVVRSLNRKALNCKHPHYSFD